MKKSFMLVVVMMISTIIFAQHKANDHKKQDGGQADKLKTELSLTDAQYASIKGIDKKYADKHAAIKKDSTLTKEKKFGQLKSLKDDKDKEVSAVLTPEQTAKWKALKAEKAEKKKEHREEAIASHEQKVKTDLALSDEQFSKFQAENKAYKDKIGALKKDDKSKEKNGAEFKKLTTEHEAKLKTIFTDEQFTKWKAMKKDKHNGHDGKHDGKKKGKKG